MGSILGRAAFLRRIRMLLRDCVGSLQVLRLQRHAYVAYLQLAACLCWWPCDELATCVGCRLDLDPKMAGMDLSSPGASSDERAAV